MSKMSEELSRAVLEADVKLLRRQIERGSGIPNVYLGDFVYDRITPPWEAGVFVSPIASWQGYCS